MSKFESTAINELIQLGRPLARESDELVLDRPLAGHRRRIRVTTALPARELPTLAPRVTPPAAVDPIARGSLDALTLPVRPIDAVTLPVRRPSLDAVTLPVRKSGAPRWLAVASLSLAGVAAFAVTYRVIRTTAPQPAMIAPAPAPAAPTVSPIAPPPAPAPRLVDIQLVSEPAGATVTLIDDGHTVLLGTTPLAAALDPSRGHDLVFALDGRGPQVVHVEAGRVDDISVRFAEAEPVPAPRVHARHAKSHHDARPGVLMVSSKPPCAIDVDGKPTGLTTPQRAIELAAGHHRITLSNPSEHVKQTFGVQIDPDHPTKLIENLMP